MQTNTNKKSQEELKKVTTQPAAAKKPVKSKRYHNSAAYAATMWHSAVGYVKPQNHTGIDL